VTLIAPVGRWPVAVPAHGIGGGRSDLPIPFTLALTAAAVVLIVSFVALAVLWPEPRLSARAGWVLPLRARRIVDSPFTHWSLRAVGLALSAYVLVAAIGGPDDALNPTAGVVYVLFWVGVVAFASALFGPVWKVLNPVRTLYLLGCLLLRRDHREGLLPYPAALGYWPASAGLLAFGWLELVAPNRATLPVLRAWFTAYFGLMLIGSVVYGSRWFDRADGFQVASSLYGRLSVLGRRDDGRLVLRNPLNGLAAVVPASGLAATVCTMLGVTVYDSVSASTFWVKFVQESSVDRVLSGSVALVSVVLLVFALYSGAVWLAGTLGHPAGTALPAAFAHTIVPIAFGYVVAHYWSLFVLVGQATMQQLSDPLGTGADLLGIADSGISYALVGASFVAGLQVVAIVLGHVLGVVLAHDRGVALFPRRTAVLGQIPLLVLMITFTVGGLLLLFTA